MVIPNKRDITIRILCNLSYTRIIMILMKKARKKSWTISRLLWKFLRIWKMISSRPTTKTWWITTFTWCRIENTKIIERSQICKLMREIMAIMMMTMMINSRICLTRKTTWTTVQMMKMITTGRLKNKNRVPTLKPKQLQIKSQIKITKFKMNASTKMNWSDTTPRMLQMPCSREKRERYQAQF